MQNIRAHGTLAEINYAVSSLPRFAGVEALHGAERTAALSGRIRLARDIDGIERAFDAAKYGGFADEPWIELTIPSIADPVAGAARDSTSSRHTCSTRRITCAGTTWDAERDRLAAAATRTIAQYAPGFAVLRSSRATVITPLDLERTYGMTGGHIFHGELSLDQWFVTRPLLGWARYRTPIERLFLCGSGTHPGTGLDGRSGALAREIDRARSRGDDRWVDTRTLRTPRIRPVWYGFPLCPWCPWCSVGGRIRAEAAAPHCLRFHAALVGR